MCSAGQWQGLWQGRFGVVAAAVFVGACGSSSSGPTSPTLTASGPTVVSIVPGTGTSAGGTTVTITGTNFAAGATVTIGGNAATNVQVVSATQISAVTGAGSDGKADVVVAVNGQSGRLTGGFTYQAPVAVTLTFTVYNHTAGPLGAFRQTAQSFSPVTLRSTTLGVLRDGTGSPIRVSSVEPDRIVVRRGAEGGRIGDFIAFASDGQVTFAAPASDASYDVFLMNRTPPCSTADGPRSGSFYGEIDSRWGPESSRVRRMGKRASTAYRAPDAGTGDGPDEPIDTAIKVFNSGLTYPWMSYGTLTRSEGSGDIMLQYGAWSWCEGHYSGWGSAGGGGISIGACFSANSGKLGRWWYGWQQNLFQFGLGFIHIDPVSGYKSSGFVLGPSGGWSPIGRDLVAYVYVRDPLGW